MPALLDTAPPAADTPAAPVAAAQAPATASAPGSGDRPLDSALGIAALLGAGGAALLRARHATAAAGIDDAGTLTALGHSAATFWAGSCTAIGGQTPAATTAGASVAIPASPLATFRSPSTLGGHVPLAIVTRSRDELSQVADGLGGRAAPALSQLRPSAAEDRTGIVTLMLAASAAAGAAIAGLLPRRNAVNRADAG